jgi:hypothetical protein
MLKLDFINLNQKYEKLEKIKLNEGKYGINSYGFAIPTTVGMGLIIILVGLTMVVRSQGDRVTAINQKSTTKSLGVTEAGIARVQALLKRYPILSAQPSTVWDSTSTASSVSAGCNASTPSSTPTTEESKLIDRSRDANWLNLNDTAPNWRELGEFRVVSYQPNTPSSGISTLIVEGRARSENSAATSTNSTSITFGNSTTALEIQFPINASGSTGHSGIWVQSSSDPIDISTDGSINASVCVKGASFDPGKINPNKLENNGAAIKSIYDGTVPTIAASSTPLPPLPAPPAYAYRLPPIDISSCHIVLPRIPTTSRTNGLTGTNCSGADKFGVAYTTTFNKTTDIPTSGIYSYLVDGTTSASATDNNGSSGGDSIKLSSGRLIIDPPTGTKVVLYVRGNVSLSGTSSGSPSNTCVGTTTPVTAYLNGFSLANTAFQNTTNWSYDNAPNTPPNANNTGLASNLEIYGADGSGGSWGTGYKMETFQVSDTTMVAGFIYAPTTIVDVSQGQISGEVWANVFKGSNSSGCRRSMVQAGVGNTLVQSLSSITLGSIRLWLRREAQ